MLRRRASIRRRRCRSRSPGRTGSGSRASSTRSSGSTSGCGESLDAGDAGRSSCRCLRGRRADGLPGHRAPSGFAETRRVVTGSWLGQRSSGQGYGTEMRAGRARARLRGPRRATSPSPATPTGTRSRCASPRSSATSRRRGLVEPRGVPIRHSKVELHRRALGRVRRESRSSSRRAAESSPERCPAPLDRRRTSSHPRPVRTLPAALELSRPPQGGGSTVAPQIVPDAPASISLRDARPKSLRWPDGRAGAAGRGARAPGRLARLRRERRRAARRLRRLRPARAFRATPFAPA